MSDIFFTPQSLPFTVALAIVLGLFALEILGLVLGLSLLGLGGEGPDLDIDTDFDMSADVADLDVDGLDLDVEVPSGPSAILGFLGMRGVPFLMWLVSFLTMFGLFGMVLQSMATSTLGAPLSPWLASFGAFIPALGATRVIANWIALLMPKTETSAMRIRFLGGHRGVITQGVATRGKPAEAKIKDRHGNIHYLRVEPLHDGAEFAHGSEVTLIRKSGDRFFVI